MVFSKIRQVKVLDLAVCFGLALSKEKLSFKHVPWCWPFKTCSFSPVLGNSCYLKLLYLHASVTGSCICKTCPKKLEKPQWLKNYRDFAHLGLIKWKLLLGFPSFMVGSLLQVVPEHSLSAVVPYCLFCMASLGVYSQQYRHSQKCSIC